MDRKMNLIEILKDKASILRATFSLNRHVSSIHVAVLRATTHDPLSSPSESKIAAVLDLGTTSRLAACTCIDIVMDRLHVTQNAFVALKCLHVIHIVVSRGPEILRDQVSYHPRFGGRNFLNMTTFTDKSDVDTWRYSSWVRWYAAVVEQSLISEREIGYYLRRSEKKKILNKDADVLKNSDLVEDIEALVEFVARVGDAPEESLGLRRNDLVYEIVKAAGEDYRAVQAEISARVSEVDDRVNKLSLSEMGRVMDALRRVEDCKERLTLLFVNRTKNEVFWEKVRKTREKVAETKAQREETRLVVVRSSSSNRRGEFDGELTMTQWWNPFLEPGQLLLLPSSSTGGGDGGGGWLGMGPSPIAV